MNFETISQHTQGLSIEKRENLLEEELLKIKLEYIDRIFSEKIPPLKNSEKDGESLIHNFKELLNIYTPVLRDLVDARIENNIENNENRIQKYDAIEDEFFNKIFYLYKNNHKEWIQRTVGMVAKSKTKNLIKAAKEGFASIKIPAETIEEIDDSHNKIGLLRYDVTKADAKWFKNTNADIAQDDVCISVHLEPLYKTIKQKSENDTISPTKYLNELAVQIVDSCPEAKAVIGYSWIMDTVIAKKFGFTVYENENLDTSGAFWSQFISRDGKIDRKRVDQFLNTGTPPYKVKAGLIKTEDFLRKYLPKERRGKIQLKERIPGIAEQINKEEIILGEIKDRWDFLNESNIVKIVSQCQIYKEFFKTASGNALYEHILFLKRSNKPEHDLVILIELARDEINTFIYNKQYKNIEVLID
jgi:hypothetical protein